MTETELTMVLAGLLHDVGRFFERTGRQVSTRAGASRDEGFGKTSSFAATVVDELPEAWSSLKPQLRRLVLNIPSPNLPDERLLHLAYRIATGRPPTTVGRGRDRTNSTRALEKVLSRVEVKGRKADARLYEPLICFPLDRGAIALDLAHENQVSTLSASAYSALSDEFLTEVGRVPFDLPTLLALLKKYLWAVPWDPESNDDADISLYAQCRGIAAVTAALIGSKLGDPKVESLNETFAQPGSKTSNHSVLSEPLFALIKGDVSGTQDFIYLLASSGAGRGLRGRSFFVQLLTEAIAMWLLRRLEMPLTNLLFAGGGHFYLFVPHNQAVEELPALRKEISSKLWSAYEGDISVIVDFVGLSVGDFVDSLSTKWDEVSKRVNERKRQRLSDTTDEVLGQFFAPRQQATDQGTICAICHGEWREDRDRVHDDVRKCNRCEGFESLGTSLRNPAWIVTLTYNDAENVAGGDWRQVLRSFGSDPYVLDEGETPPSKEGALAYSVSALDSCDFITPEVLKNFNWGSVPTSYDFRFFANATPYEEKYQVAGFQELAKDSTGAKWLGVLRMDVDDLGEVFKRGLKPRSSIARISTLSDSLRLFFEGWVPSLCRRLNGSPKGGRVFLVYAGGDDLFIVGSWSSLPDLAKQIRDDFRAFVSGDHVSLSGGIAIEHQKYPLYQLAEDAKHALDDQAKFCERGSKTKDALTFLQVPIGWEQFGPIEQWKDRLIAMLEPPPDVEKALPRGFLTRMREIHFLYEDNARRQRRLARLGEVSLNQMREEIAYAKWVWRLVYHLGQSKEALKAFETKLEQFREQLIQHNLIERLNVIARWTELLTREEKE